MTAASQALPQTESWARDCGDKFFEYEAGGVPEYWLLDPVRQQAEFYQLGADGIYRPAALDKVAVGNAPAPAAVRAESVEINLSAASQRFPLFLRSDEEEKLRE